MAFGPMDVYEAGRMAFCQDPQGAFFRHLAGQAAYLGWRQGRDPARCAGTNC